MPDFPNVEWMSPDEFFLRFKNDRKDLSTEQLEALRDLLHGDDKFEGSLVACPFCGGGESADGTTFLHVAQESNEGDYKGAYFVECCCCYARGPISWTYEEAKEAWNNRWC